ncbi:twin-arginine translocase subunit TatC [Lentilitoribacter sp. EG35]|uniref:twin-arginine translocase subunit TatC n=1 Tax=Lentilitoribacter sp. EG35 TaxID=3234192 RepID=UPI0034600E95
MNDSVSNEAEIDDQPQPLVEHLVELRRRMIWAVAGFIIAFAFCFALGSQIYNLLILPYSWAVEWSGIQDQEIKFIFTAPQEFFFTQVKIGFFGGMLLSFPVIATQIYKFVAPGLYKNERSAFLPFLIASPILFIIGGAIVYFVLIPVAMLFFLGTQQLGGSGVASITLLPKTSEYLSLIMTLIFAFGLVFQLPVVTTLMARAGLLTAETLSTKRKYAIVLAFIMAAVLTPPDPASQIGLALPTILLYEVAIYCARIVDRRRKEELKKSGYSDEDEE